jgi:hypothetical protein
MGADLSASCLIYGTVLYYAAMLGLEKIVKLLVEAVLRLRLKGVDMAALFRRHLLEPIA